MEKSTIQKEFFLQIYEECFPPAASYIKKMGGSYDEAKDIFQDALVIFFERRRDGETEVRNAPAYITGIVKHLWYRRYRENQRWTGFDEYDPRIAASVEDYEKPVSEKLLAYLASAGRKCMEILQAFYYKKHSLSDIAGDFGFSGTRSATVQKYKCLEQVRETIKEKELSYADFLE